MRRRNAPLALVLLPFAGLACIPTPFVEPPIKLDGSSGIQGDLGPGGAVRAPVTVAAGVYPMGLFESLKDRTLDFGVGGLYMTDGTEQRAGGYLSAAAVVFRQTLFGLSGRLMPEVL